MKGFQPQAFGFIAAVSHPQKAAQTRVFMWGEAKRTMTIHPAIGIGFTPGGFPVDAPEPIRDDPFFFLLLMPDGPFGFGHHFIGADNLATGQVQETVEK